MINRWIRLDDTHISDHADDAKPILRFGLVLQRDSLSDGIFAWPKAARHGVADDHDARSAFRVVLGKTPPA